MWKSRDKIENSNQHWLSHILCQINTAKTEKNDIVLWILKQLNFIFISLYFSWNNSCVKNFRFFCPSICLENLYLTNYRIQRNYLIQVIISYPLTLAIKLYLRKKIFVNCTKIAENFSGVLDKHSFLKNYWEQTLFLMFINLYERQ